MPTQTTEKGKPRFSRPAVKILREWLSANHDRPYPSKEEKVMLQHSTGLSATQISTWFTNARRRSNFNTPSSSSLDREKLLWSDMDALDRWRHSPPEFEPASMDDLAKALARSGSSFPSEPRPTTPSLASHPRLQASSPSEDFDASSCWVSSAGSSESQDSYVSDKSTELRRRRRRRRYCPKSRGDGDNRIFQCTFCTDRFKSKYDWTRHESSLHLSLECWTCAPFGPTLLGSRKHVAHCAFCNAEEPSEDHIEAHRFFECNEKPVEARRFYRKDHLRQHLQQMHNVHNSCLDLDDWKSKRSDVRSRCGFCNETFDDWPTRNDHLVRHFRAGAVMKSWTGCRGLDPSVAMMVQNAIPPYLIGNETEAMVPFSAEAAQAQPSNPSNTQNDHYTVSYAAPTSFQTLVSELSAFVNEQKQRAYVPSDHQLQSQARLIVYGDDDPWNQTAADNMQWLELFKMGHGIDSHTLTARGASEPQPAMVTASSVIDRDTFKLPWYWQSPECLAEYRKCQDSFSTAGVPSARPEIAAGQSDSRKNSYIASPIQDTASSVEQAYATTVDNFVAANRLIQPDENDDRALIGAVHQSRNAGPSGQPDLPSLALEVSQTYVARTPRSQSAEAEECIWGLFDLDGYSGQSPK